LPSLSLLKKQDSGRVQRMFKSESEFVHWLQKISPRRVAGLALGIGDDAAVVRIAARRELILTTDLSIEGVHFLRRLHPARSVGHRALARALSDVAAMGGTARFALLSLALTKQTARRWVEDFYAGTAALARRTGVTIVGGDTALVRGRMFVDVVVAGEIPAGAALRRSGARPGDRIYVSGRLGLSALGLELLKSRRRAATSLARRAIRAHLYPKPRLALGRFLRENRLATALMDVSDGLSTDLARLCEASRVGALLASEKITGCGPSGAGESRGTPSLELALNGGEDYELLFTVRPEKLSRIPARFGTIPLRSIGAIRRSKKLQILLPGGKLIPLVAGGYDHFRK
jgi:thiamine-monophosphate kinase